MSPKLQCHCNVGYKKNIHCPDHFHTKFNRSLTLEQQIVLACIIKQTCLDIHRLHPSKTILSILSRLQQLIYVTVSSLPFISNASMALGIGMFLFVGPTTEKSFFFIFLRFETIASFTHVLYQCDNGAAQCFVIYYLCMN